MHLDFKHRREKKRKMNGICFGIKGHEERKNAND